MTSEGAGRENLRGAPAAPAFSLVIPTRGLLAIAGLIVVTWLSLLLVDRARSALSLVIGALAVAVVVGPLVSWLARLVPRALAIVVVTLAGMAAMVALVATVGWDLNRQAEVLADDVETAVNHLPADSTAADLADRVDLSDRAHEVLDDFAAQVVLGDADPLAAAGQLSKLVVISVMAAFMVAEGQSLLETATRAVPRRSTRADIHATVRAAVRRAGSFGRRTATVSALHGLGAGLAVAALGLPGAISLGAWVALAVTMPILGGPLAWAPIVAVAYAGGIAPVAVAALAVAAIVADRVARRRWVDQALRVGPLLTLLGIGAGLYTLGIPGGFVGLVAIAAAAGATTSRGDGLGHAAAELVDDPSGPHPANEPIEASPDRERGTAPGRKAEAGTARTLRVTLAPRTAVAAAALVFLTFTLYRLVQEMESFVVWIAVGGFIAIGLDRPVAAMNQSWRLPRVAAIALVIGGLVAFIGTVGVLAGPSVTDSANQVVNDAPEAVESLESLPLIGQVLADNDASARIEEEITRLPDRLSDSALVERVVASAGDGVIGFYWLVSIVLATLLDGPRLVHAARELVPVRSRRRAMDFGQAAYTTLSNVAAASAFVAVLNGIVVMLIALFLGIPLPPVLGVWAAAWNFIPQIGGFVGALPLVLLGVAQGPGTGIIALVVFVTYQSFENHVLQPAVGSRAVDLPPLVVLIGVLVGGALFGFVGAILSGPTLGVTKVAALQVRGSRPARVED